MYPQEATSSAAGSNTMPSAPQTTFMNSNARSRSLGPYGAMPSQNAQRPPPLASHQVPHGALPQPSDPQLHRTSTGQSQTWYLSPQLALNAASQTQKSGQPMVPLFLNQMSYPAYEQPNPPLFYAVGALWKLLSQWQIYPADPSQANSVPVRNVTGGPWPPPAFRNLTFLLDQCGGRYDFSSLTTSQLYQFARDLDPLADACVRYFAGQAQGVSKPDDPSATQQADTGVQVLLAFAKLCLCQSRFVDADQALASIEPSLRARPAWRQHWASPQLLILRAEAMRLLQQPGRARALLLEAIGLLKDRNSPATQQLVLVNRLLLLCMSEGDWRACSQLFESCPSLAERVLGQSGPTDRVLLEHTSIKDLFESYTQNGVDAGPVPPRQLELYYPEDGYMLARTSSGTTPAPGGDLHVTSQMYPPRTTIDRPSSIGPPQSIARPSSDYSIPPMTGSMHGMPSSFPGAIANAPMQSYHPSNALHQQSLKSHSLTMPGQQPPVIHQTQAQDMSQAPGITMLHNAQAGHNQHALLARTSSSGHSSGLSQVVPGTDPSSGHLQRGSSGGDSNSMNSALAGTGKRKRRSYRHKEPRVCCVPMCEAMLTKESLCSRHKKHENIPRTFYCEVFVDVDMDAVAFASGGSVVTEQGQRVAGKKGQSWLFLDMGDVNFPRNQVPNPEPEDFQPVDCRMETLVHQARRQGLFIPAEASFSATPIVRRFIKPQGKPMEMSSTAIYDHEGNPCFYDSRKGKNGRKLRPSGGPTVGVAVVCFTKNPVAPIKKPTGANGVASTDTSGNAQSRTDKKTPTLSPSSHALCKEVQAILKKFIADTSGRKTLPKFTSVLQAMVAASQALRDGLDGLPDKDALDKTDAVFNTFLGRSPSATHGEFLSADAHAKSLSDAIRATAEHLVKMLKTILTWEINEASTFSEPSLARLFRWLRSLSPTFVHEFHLMSATPEQSWLCEQTQFTFSGADTGPLHLGLLTIGIQALQQRIVPSKRVLIVPVVAQTCDRLWLRAVQSVVGLASDAVMLDWNTKVNDLDLSKVTRGIDPGDLLIHCDTEIPALRVKEWGQKENNESVIDLVLKRIKDAASDCCPVKSTRRRTKAIAGAKRKRSTADAPPTACCAEGETCTTESGGGSVCKPNAKDPVVREAQAQECREHLDSTYSAICDISKLYGAALESPYEPVFSTLVGIAKPKATQAQDASDDDSPSTLSQQLIRCLVSQSINTGLDGRKEENGRTNNRLCRNAECTYKC